MNGYTMFFCIVGVCYVSYLLTKAIVWIDTTRKRKTR